MALFAALSYAVTQSSNPAGNNASKEQADLIAAQIVQSAAGIKFAYDRLNISGRYDQIHFDDSADNPAGIVYNGTASPGTGRTIGLFNSSTGVSISDLPETGFNATVLFNIAFQYTAAQIDSNSDGTADVSVGSSGGVDTILRYAALTRAVCESLNRRLNGTTDIFTFSRPAGGLSNIGYDLSTKTFNVPTTSSTSLFLPDLPICAENVLNSENLQLYYPIDVK